jgi:glucokinase
MHTTNTIIAIDIGGTKISVARADAQGHLQETHTFATPHGHPDETLPAALAQIETRVADWVEAGAGAIGIAAPGPTDRERGVLLLCPSLGWQNVALKEHFEQRFGLPVGVSNDVQAAALGELHFGWGQKPLDSGRLPQHLFWMTVSTGIGGSIVADGRVYRGNGAAGEIGHLLLVENGPVGACDHAGCLESLASGPAIAARARVLIQQGEPSLLSALANNPAHISPPQIAQAARQGDALAQRVWQEAGSYIGRALSYVIHLLDPDLLVLGGGVFLGAGDLLLEPITAFAHDPRHYLSGTSHSLPPIVQTMHGGNAGLVGAAALAISHCTEET